MFISIYDFLNFLILPILLLFIGLWGIIILHKNLLAILIALEILLLAVNLNFAFGSFLLNSIDGEVFSLFILTIAGAESAIGLAILIAFYRLRSIIAIDLISLLKA